MRSGKLIKSSLEEGSRSTLEVWFYEEEKLDDTKLTSITTMILHWLHDYLDKKPTSLDFPTDISLTTFSQQVLERTAMIPFGKTMTYQDIAIDISSPNSARAVGNALNQNPLPLFIPCHRIVSKADGLGGFAFPSEIKKALLTFEGAF